MKKKTYRSHERLRETAEAIVIGGVVLKLGQNTQHRLRRPGWTTKDENSFNHRHGRHLERNFFLKTEGFYRKMPKNASLGDNKGGGVH